MTLKWRQPYAGIYRAQCVSGGRYVVEQGMDPPHRWTGWWEPATYDPDNPDESRVWLGTARTARECKRWCAEHHQAVRS